MRRREFLAASAAIACAQTAPAPVLMVSTDEADRMLSLSRREPNTTITRLADSSLKRGPWSVTFDRPPAELVTAAANDYYSEGPYWWPDPKNPKGPYIRRDGERNPDRFQANRTALGAMSDAVLALGLGAFVTRERRYTDRAALALSTWFADPKTRMNPNLEFGQAIRGRNTGRGTGIIDTVSLIYCAQGMTLAEAAGGFDRSISAAVREWYRDYLRWMTESKKGRDEKNANNNHATWWTAQVAAFATLTGDAGLCRLAWNQCREKLVPEQIRPDGSCPREEARTRSLSYSSMNLDGFSILCRLADRDGQNLWPGPERAFRYLLPFVLDPSSWKKPQITPYDQDRVLYPGLAGLGLKSAELLAAYRKLPRAATPLVQMIDLLVRA